MRGFGGKNKTMSNPYKIEFKGSNLNVSLKDGKIDGEVESILLDNSAGGYTMLHCNSVKLIHPEYLKEIKTIINEKYNH